jgi:hypothetical protein
MVFCDRSNEKVKLCKSQQIFIWPDDDHEEAVALPCNTLPPSRVG